MAPPSWCRRPTTWQTTYLCGTTVVDEETLPVPITPSGEISARTDDRGNCDGQANFTVTVEGADGHEAFVEGRVSFDSS